MVQLTDSATTILVAVFITFIISSAAITGAALLMRVLRVLITAWGVSLE